MDELALELDSRRKIFEAVCRYPGTHLREIGRTVGFSINLVDYHLTYLEKRGLVYSHEDGQYKRYFPKEIMDESDGKGMVSASDKEVVSLLRRPWPFRITLLVLKNGSMTHGDVVREIKISPSTVSHHISRLLVAGVIQKKEGGAEYSIRDPGRIEKLLLRFNPQPANLTDGFAEIWEDLVL